jgi:hypothetical protein
MAAAVLRELAGAILRKEGAEELGSSIRNVCAPEHPLAPESRALPIQSATASGNERDPEETKMRGGIVADVKRETVNHSKSP